MIRGSGYPRDSSAVPAVALVGQKAVEGT